MREIKKWEKITNTITERWVSHYFELEDEEEAPAFWWIAGEVGGIFEFADYYFNFSDVLNCYKHNITKDQLFNWYDYCLENQSINISLAKYVISPEEKAKKRKNI